MKKSFQLSAVAIAIAASSSVMADVIDTTVTPSFDTDALMSVTATTVNAGSQLFVAGQDVGSTLAQNTTDISTNAANIAQNTADISTNTANIAQNTTDISTNTANIAQNTADISTNAANIAQNTNVINQEVVDRTNEVARLDSRVDQEVIDRQAGDAAIMTGIATGVTTNALQVNGNAAVTGDLTVNGILKANINLSDVVTSTVVNSQKSNTANTIKYVGVTDENGGLVDVYEIAVDKNGTKAYIRADDNKEFKGNITQLDPSNLKPADFTGRSDNTVGTKTTTDQVSQVTKSQVKYGESKTEQESVEFNARLNDDLGNSEINTVNGGFGPVKVLNDQSVELGIIAQDNDNNNIYGVVAKDIKDGVENTTTLNGKGLTTTGNLSAKTITVDGTDVKATLDTHTTAIAANTADIAALDTRVATNETNIAANTAAIAQEVTDRIQGDADTLAAANTHTDNIATALRGEAAAETVRVNGELQAASDDRAAIRTEFAAADTTLQNNIDAEAATREAADNAATTDRAAIRTEFAAADTTLQNNIDAEAATREAADNAATTDRAAIRTEFAAADTTLQNNIDAEAATRLAADNAATTDRAAIRTEFAAADTTLQNNIDAEATTRAAADTALNTRVTNETAARQAADDVLDARVTTNTTDIATNKAAIAKEVTDRQTAITAEANARIAGDAATLKSANTYTDTKATETLAAANAYTNTRVDQLNSRVDDVQKTAYRGIAIALAAQQAVPSIQPGQVAVFGGVGHYEGETAGSIGVVTAFTDRISASGAFGFASGNEFGGRVGIAYVFGGK